MTLPEHLEKEIAAKLKGKRLTDAQKKEIRKRVLAAHTVACVAPGEAIGIVTAECFGEPSTQMSLSYFEKVIVKIDGVIQIVRIGEFVDSFMQKFGNLTIDAADILPLRDVDVLVPSLDKDEKIVWKKVVELSRHASPKKLLRLVTRSGRKIVATDNHSFVTRLHNAVVPVLGKDLTVGSRIPVLKYLPEHCVASIAVADYISVPGKDHFLVTKSYNPLKLLPESFVLDWDFGWFVGAYLAEGGASAGQVGISNLDEDFISHARRFVGSIGLDFVEKAHQRGFANSRDFIVNSSLLARFMRATCGTGSDSKFVPVFAYSAKEKFVAGLLRGYFDGDGNVSVARGMIRVSSDSEDLVDGIKLLLTRFDIFASKSFHGGQYWLTVAYKYAPVFLAQIGLDIAYKREDLVRLAALAEKNVPVSYRDHVDMISGFDDVLVCLSRKLGLPTRYVNSATKRQKIGRCALQRHIDRFSAVAAEKRVDVSSELALLQRMVASDVVWDEIVAVEYVDSPHVHVYDFSVPGLETFTTFDGVVTHNTLNTFHFAGVAEMSVTVGLPRLIEIFDARKNPSTPLMQIYLKPKYCRTTAMVTSVAQRIRETRIEHLSKSISINVAKNSVEIELDKAKLKEYALKPGEVFEALRKLPKTIEVEEAGGKIQIYRKTKDILLPDVFKLKEKVKKLPLFGLKGVTQVLPVKEDGEFVIHCAGSNLKDALALEEVDPLRTTTNNLFEIAEVLGIEAARAAVIHEAQSVIASQGLSVDVRHIMFLADVMTRGGQLRGITRTGITGEKESVLARASFETPLKHIIHASLIGERDDLSSVVENVILNQPIPVGTGLPGLVAKDGDKK